VTSAPSLPEAASANWANEDGPPEGSYDANVVLDSGAALDEASRWSLSARWLDRSRPTQARGQVSAFEPELESEGTLST